MKKIILELTLAEAELIKNVLEDVNVQSRELLLETCNRGNAPDATPETQKECEVRIESINHIWKTANDLWRKISKEILNANDDTFALRLTPEALELND